MGTACNEEKLLVLDVHKAQKTDPVKSKLAKYKTELVYVIWNNRFGTAYRCSL